VVPQGGNTGLVGGSVPVYDEVIVVLNILVFVLGMMINIHCFIDSPYYFFLNLMQNMKTFLRS
jgi:hypothetical protein